MEDNAILIGFGSLSWPRMERVSDKYGYIGLYDFNSEDQRISEGAHLNITQITKFLNNVGQLVAQVSATRQSTHIGDSYRGFAPKMPDKGEEIVLGYGKLSYLLQDGEHTVGLLPLDNRQSDWLNPEMLYRAHEQTINLYFIPD